MKACKVTLYGSSGDLLLAEARKRSMPPSKLMGEVLALWQAGLLTEYQIQMARSDARSTRLVESCSQRSPDW